MSVCERDRVRRKQVYNPVGIMQTSGKRLADSRITLAIVAEQTAGKRQEGEKGRVLFDQSHGLGHILGLPKVAYSM